MSSLGETPSGPGGFSETRQLTLGDCVTYVTFHSFLLTSMSKRTWSQYIDDSAEVDHDPLMREDASDDDDNSYEAQLHRQDREDFDMDAIDAGHEDQLHSDARYTIPTPLLQSGVETPSRSDDFYDNIPSRAPSPVPAWTAPAQSGSRASTPIYIPPQDDRDATFFPTLVGPIPRREETPLFGGLQLPPPHRDFSPVPSLTSPAPSRPTSAEPPAKKRRVESGADAEDSPHRRRLHRFLDVSAEDSDKEEEEEEEDEETLSDKEYLDDEPVHDDPQHRRPVFPEEDKTEDDLLCPVPASTASAPPVVVEDTFIPDTWVIPKYGLHKGLLALVLTKQMFLAAPVSTSTAVGQSLMGHQEYNKCIEVTLASDMVRKNFTPVHPTPDQLAAFLSDDHPALEKLRFKGLGPALAEGDRVVVIAGPHQGETGFLVMLHELPVTHQRVKYAKVVKVYNGVGIVKKGDAGLTEFALCQASSIGEQLDFWCGDLVHVRSGKHKGRVGLIIATFIGGSIEIFDGDKPNPEQTEIPSVVVRAADVDFATFGERESGLTIEHAGISLYTPTSHIAALKPPIHDQAAEQKAAAKVEAAKRSLPSLCRQLGQLEAKGERTEAENIDCAVLVAQIMRLNQMVRGMPSDAGHVDFVDTKIMNTGHCYEGIPVLVARKGIHKGFQGTVIGDHDSEARVRRLAKSAGKGRTYGMMRTRTASSSPSRATWPTRRWMSLSTNAYINSRFLPRDVLMGHVPRTKRAIFKGLFRRRKLLARAYAFSAAIRELLWAAIPETPLAVIGITGVKERVSNTLQKLEGRFGHILVTAGSTWRQEGGSLRVGKSGTKHAVQSSASNRQEEHSGRLITEVAERVVVIGPDMAGDDVHGVLRVNTTDIPHYYEAGVSVFSWSAWTGSSLCLAKNVALTYQNQVFAATTFPP
ncbi:hypothetical protein B0H13DRAFT_1890412 [Mycena leptocephala]|nr:hypothetical protein B0H13DRAFT_1890412 [Mycena leptocephala]